MTGARWSSRREPSWRGDKRLSTQMMRSPWQRVIICRCLALPALFIFVLRPLNLGFSLRVSALCDAGHRLDQDHRGPRTRPPTNQPTNPVSTNAFRPESACFFFFFLAGSCWAAASADCNRIQSGIKRWFLTPESIKRKKGKLVCVTGFWTSLG